MANIVRGYACRGRVAAIGGPSPTITSHLAKNVDEGLIGWPRS